jgi:DNA-binding CsgD family transcriptional regulator
MTRVRDISFIRKLCSIGLPAPAVAQCLLPELRKLIPSHSAGVFWVDSEREMTSLYAERLLPPDAMARYYERHYAVRAKSFSDAFRLRAQSNDPVSQHSFSRAEQETDYFRDVMHPLDAYHVLYGILKDGTRPIAQISFYRGIGDNAFDRASADTLRALIRYLAMGLGGSASSSVAEGGAVTVDEDVGIVSSSGSLISGSEGWHRLLRLAALSEVSPRNALKQHEAIELFVRRVCGDLLPRQARTTPPHELRHETAWGRFVIRAFLLREPTGASTGQAAILIRREEPRSLALVRGTGIAALSPQQREVALLIVAGKSNREIADDLGLSFNTASSHVKQVYARLEVNERAAVAMKLLRLAQSAVAG